MTNQNEPSIVVAIVFLIILVGLGALAFWSLSIAYYDYKEYKTYKNFCEDKPTFCYCEFDSCGFKTSWSSETGFSNYTLELCDLATKLNDKETLFKVGCK